MVLHFNVKGESRKAMVKAIEQELGCKAKYLRVPSCAYEVGNYTVGKNGELEFGDFDDIDEATPVIDACVRATGVRPTEMDDGTKQQEEEDKMLEEENSESESFGLTVSVPLDKVDVGNLTCLLEAKGELIKKALGVADTRFSTDEENIHFPWFEEVEPEAVHTYTKFIAALCEMSKKQKRITAKSKQNENEKYAFRCFLLRLGFIGDEYKADRKVLLSNLNGSSAFKGGAKKGGEQ